MMTVLRNVSVVRVVVGSRGFWCMTVRVESCTNSLAPQKSFPQAELRSSESQSAFLHEADADSGSELRSPAHKQSPQFLSIFEM